MTERPLDGQVTVVTGGGRGIGRAVALAAAQAGSAVAVGSRTVGQLVEVAGEVERRGAQVMVEPLDVTDVDSVRRFVAATLDRFGRVDLLVNNAGSNNGGAEGAIGPLWEINPLSWWDDVETNLRGTFLSSHAVLPYMVAAGRGRIVNIVSLAAMMPWPYDSAYACSKAAVIRLTDSLSEELRNHGIYVFALSPGSVDTELRAGAVNSPAGRQWLTRVNPSPQWIPAEAPAQAVVFLGSGKADGLSGRVLSIDWDLQELARQSDDISSRDVLQLRFLDP
jgi:NAD(P)-dependent dehydrogenase (short-subunit alcohol dehydrogenase family)